MTSFIQTSSANSLQDMRVAVVALLRNSEIDEVHKRSLMIMLPHLPAQQLSSILAKLEKEAALQKKAAQRISPEKALQIRNAVKVIKRKAWKQSEKEQTPSPEEVDNMLSEKLSQL